MQTLFILMTVGVATLIMTVLASNAQAEAEEVVIDAYSFFELTSEDQKVFDSVERSISLFRGVFVVNFLILVLEIIHVLFFFRKNVKRLCYQSLIPMITQKERTEVSQI